MQNKQGLKDGWEENSKVNSLKILLANTMARHWGLYQNL